ncbi:flippase [Serratia sp. D1N4]
MLELNKDKFIKNISWNLVGFVFPILAAIVIIPLLMKNIGMERFGILTLIFALIGFMNIFDFGLTRSITNSVVKYRNSETQLLASIKTGWFIIVVLLSVVALLILLFHRSITESIFNVSNAVLEQEVNNSLLIIALSLPFVISQATFTGVLEAFGCFKKISLAKIPFSILMYLVPAIVSFFNNSLLYITMSLCILRVLMAVFFFILMHEELKQATQNSLLSAKIQKDIAIELFKYGGWVSISNIIAPIMLYIDRFFVASIVGASLVAYYTTPYEVVSKMTIVAVSVSGVLFPILASKIPTEIKVADKFFKKSLLGIFLILFPPVVVGVLFSDYILTLWINDVFAKQASLIFSIFLIGFLIHGLIQPAFTWIQASGKPYITAMAHVFDLTFYIIYFPALTKHYGIVGAASAWVIRVSISFIVLHSIRLFFYRRSLK